MQWRSRQAGVSVAASIPIEDTTTTTTTMKMAATVASLLALMKAIIFGVAGGCTNQ
jgi:hypothetical protein